MTRPDRLVVIVAALVSLGGTGLVCGSVLPLSVVLVSACVFTLGLIGIVLLGRL